MQHLILALVHKLQDDTIYHQSKPQPKREFGREFDLDFVDSEKTESPATVGAAAKYAEIVIAMTKFISHPALKVIRNHSGYMPVYGAVTKVRETLHHKPSP
jgi:hypothetical protein